MTHPRYVFLSFYWYTEFWWRDNITRGDNRYDPEFCDQFQLMAALHRSFAPDYFTTATPEEADQPTDVGYVSLLIEYVPKYHPHMLYIYIGCSCLSNT